MVRTPSSIILSLCIPFAGLGCADTEPTAPPAAPLQPAKLNAPLPQVALGTQAVSDVASVEVEPQHAFQALADAGAAAEAQALPPPATLYDTEALAHDATARDFLKEARRLLKEDRAGEAIIAARHALYDADSAPAWALLGRAYLRAAQPERGIQALERSVQLKGDHAATRRLIRAYLDAGDAATARLHAESFTLKHPKDAPGQYLLGLSYMKLAMWKEAMAAFEAVLETEPKNIFARNNIGYAALQVGESELAVVHLERCLDLTPLKPYMLNNLGLAYEKSGRKAEAWAAYSRALELRTDYVKGKLNLARVSQHLSDDERALAVQTLKEMSAPVASVSVASAQPDGDIEIIK